MQGFPPMRSFVLLAAMITASPLIAQHPIYPKVQASIDRILRKTPLIDGHNDIAEQLADKYKRSIEGLASGTDKREQPLMTDMARLRQGRVGGQFWSVFIDGNITGDAAIRETIQQRKNRFDDRSGRRTSDGRVARGVAAILQPRRALHDADSQPDDRMGGQRHG